MSKDTYTEILAWGCSFIVKYVLIIKLIIMVKWVSIIRKMIVKYFNQYLKNVI